MTRLIPALTLLFALPGCVIYGGSGTSETENRALGTITAVSNGTWLDVGIVAGGADQVVSVTCDDNLLQYIRTDLSGTQVSIKVADENGQPVIVDAKTDCRVDLAVTTLESLSSSGSGDATASGSLVGLHDVSTSGSGDTTVSGVSSDRIAVIGSGSGDVTAAGAAGVIDVLTSGSGDVHARELIAERAVVRISGSGDVEVTATESVDIQTSGSGDVHVWGGPDQVDQNTSGSGDVTLHGDDPIAD